MGVRPTQLTDCAFQTKCPNHSVAPDGRVNGVLAAEEDAPYDTEVILSDSQRTPEAEH